MIFTNPLGLLLLVSIPVIILLHLFRQERRRQVVPSLYLWREISDQHSRRVRPRLLRNINLLLQVLAALLASLALAGPVVETGTVAGARELIVLVDDSASMQSDAGGVSRIELARNRAREIIGRTPRATRILVASAGPRPSVLQTYTTDRALLYEVIGDIGATDGANDLDAALALIRNLGAGENTRVVFITDAALSYPDPLPANLSVASVVGGGGTSTEETGGQPDGTDRAGSADLASSPGGAGGVNRAITAFELRSRPDGTAFEVLAAVANFADEAADLVLEVSADNEVLATRELVVEAGEERFVTASIPRVRGTVYRAQLLGNTDALPVDDSAFAAARGERPVRVQLVTGGNLFLESFLSIYPNVQLNVTDSVEYGSYDVLILDRIPAPARLQGNVVTFGTALPDGPFTPEQSRESEQGITVRTRHPIIHGVQLEQMQVRSFVTGTLDPRATVIAAAGTAPILYTYRSGSLNLVGTTFDLTTSDLALRGSFPVLMHNIVEWLAPVAPAGDVGYTAVGSIVPLYVPPGEEVVVITPEGSPLRYTPRTTPFEFSATDQAGIYEVRGESFRSRFAVSLASTDESNLASRLAGLSRSDDQDLLEEQAGVPIWHWLALLALLLLVADWIIWARRH